MEVGEPHSLTEVGALAGGLEEQPLLQEVLFGEGGVGELVGLVVGVDEVLDDGAGFPQRDVCVWVLDGGDAAVGVDFLVVGLLELRVVHVFGLEGDVELSEDDGYFPWVGGAGSGAVSGTSLG